MHRMNRFNTLHFNDHHTFDHKVDAISQFDFFAVINDRQANLTRNRKPALLEFMLQARAIGTLKQSGSQKRMEFYCRGASETKSR